MTGRLGLSACNTTPLTYSVGGTGLTSVKVNGFEMLGDPNTQGAFGLWGLDAYFTRADGSQYLVKEDASSRTWDTASSSLRLTYSWGAVTVTYSSPCGNQLRADLDIVNGRADKLSSLAGFLAVLDFPVAPVAKSWAGTVPLATYPQSADPARGLPALAIDMNGSATFAIVDDSDPKLATSVGNMLGFNSPMRYSVQWRFNETVASGAHGAMSASFRAGPPAAAIETLMPDVVQRYAAAFPQLAWTDRRPLGSVFLSSAPGSLGGNPPTNPRGWIFMPAGADIRTAAGLAAFRSGALTLIDTTISNVKAMQGQGLMIWDIEGQEYPHAISYVCDPPSMNQFAPEMNYKGAGDLRGVADEIFYRVKAAGLKAGVCLRPQPMVCSNGNCTRPDVADPAGELAPKVDYAAKRWGTSMYYVDSNVHASFGSPIPAHMLFGAALALQPNSMFAGEWQDGSYYAVGGPYDSAYHDGVTGTGNESRNVYPNAFGVIAVDNLQDGTTMAQLAPRFLASLKRGDILMARSWYQPEDWTLLRDLSAQVGSRPGVAITAPAAGASITGPQVTLNATASSPDRSLTKVEFFTAGLKIGEVTSAPYNLLWLDAPKGRHTLNAQVTDANGVVSAAAPVVIEVK